MKKITIQFLFSSLLFLSSFAFAAPIKFSCSASSPHPYEPSIKVERFVSVELPTPVLKLDTKNGISTIRGTEMKVTMQLPFLNSYKNLVQDTGIDLGLIQPEREKKGEYITGTIQFTLNKNEVENICKPYLNSSNQLIVKCGGDGRRGDEGPLEKVMAHFMLNQNHTELKSFMLRVHFELRVISDYFLNPAEDFQFIDSKVGIGRSFTERSLATPLVFNASQCRSNI